MGWSDEEVEGIAVAGYLHDIGKLVVERDIINAPYRIDAKQSSELNRHPAAGYEILLPISHPYADIPLMARIVQVADSYDAMVARRAYNSPRTRDDAAAELRREAGRQFDPRAVEAFLDTFSEGW